MSAPQPPCGHLDVSPDEIARLGIGAVALRYALLGLPVFPLRPGTKKPDTEHGFKDATTDLAVIEQWWAEDKVRNIGIATGAATIIDLDRKNGVDGAASFLAWLAEHGLSLPYAPWEDTPSDGRHLWLRTPAGLTVPSRAGILPGVDIRASGGYVAAWPSGIARRMASPERPGGETVYGTYSWHGCPHEAPEMPALIGALGQLPGTSSGGGAGSGNGGDLPPTDVLLEHGVEHPHDGNLAALCARLARQGKTEAEAHAIWQAVVDKTPTDPAWPYAHGDFTRMWKGAKAKFPAAEVAPDTMAYLAQATAQGTVPPASGESPAAAPAELTGQVIGPPQVVFPKTGLHTSKAASWVLGQGRLAWGADNQLWAYQNGVWVPGEEPDNDLVHQRITWLLGKDFRQGHGTNIREMIRAQVPYLACDPLPDIINFRNGLLHWRGGDELAEPNANAPCTVQLAVNWNPAAACPAFDDFLARALPPGDVTRMWDAIGYSLMSGNPLHKMILLYGDGFNGKGVLLRVLTAVLGPGNVSAVSLHSLAEERFTRIGLLGKTANICGDIDATYIEKTGLLKQLTGEDLISAEHKFRKPAQFTSWAVPWFSANEIPASSDTSQGWLKRWEVFAFPAVFAMNPGYEATLKSAAELEGIAAHGVRSLRELMGRTPPAFTATAAGDAAKGAFAARQDPLSGWMTERCWWGTDGWWTGQRDAYASYKAWCDTSGVRYPLTKTRFYDLMRKKFGTVMHDGYPGFAGLALQPVQNWIG